MDRIRFAAVSRNYFNMPLWVAGHCGLFADEGLDVQVELHEPIDEVTRRLEDGRVDLAYGVTEHVIVDREKGGSTVIVGGNVNKLPFSFIAGKDIRSFADLRGRTIGVSSRRAGSSSLAMKLLEAHGLHYPQDYAIEEVGPILARWEKLQSGEIDAGLQGAPLNYIAIDQGYPTLCEPRDQFPWFQFASLHVDGEWAVDNADLMARFMRAFVRAHKRFFADRDTMVRIAMQETRIEERYAGMAWEEYTKEQIFPPDGDVSSEGVQALIDVSAVIREIPDRQGTSAEAYIDRSYLHVAQAETAGE
jgi:ABC-type nitrate/sulfonate/bicarbonate transport system substrate-binding protein